MILILFQLIALVVFSLIRFSASEILAPVAEKTHIFCISQLPLDSFSLAELKALVCAENFSNIGESELYISTGLIHLFVVSGAHLILIERILKVCRCRENLVFPLMLMYGFACNLNAPVCRCLFAFMLSDYLSKKNIVWPVHFRVLAIGLTTLAFNYTWISSLSLQMSWIAAFLVMLGKKFFMGSSSLFKQSLFFISLFPTLVFFQVPSISIILVNLIFAPILEFFLFPLGLLTWFFSFSYPVFDFFIILIKKFLTLLEMDYQFQLNELPENLVFFNWIFIFSLHLTFHLLDVVKLRKLKLYES